MGIYDLFEPANIPGIVILASSVLLAGVIAGVALMKSYDDNEDETDCFSKEHDVKLTKHNESIKEEFTVEEEQEPDQNNPDVLIVLRTDYKTAVRLSESGHVEDYIGKYPTAYTIHLKSSRRNSF